MPPRSSWPVEWHAQPVHRGRCSCPIGVDCKHAAALLLAARGLPALAAQLGRPEWERSLGRLAAAAQPVREPDDVRLGLEFDLEQSPGYRGSAGPLRLRVRPVNRGSSGRWVRSGVGWEQLDYLASGYRSEQRDLLLQLWASAGASARFAYPRSPWLDLSAISPSLWSVLERAQVAGLGLVTAAGTDDLVLQSGEAAIGLDARLDADGDTTLSPVVLVGGSPVATGRLGVAGRSGTRIVLAEPAARSAAVPIWCWPRYTGRWSASCGRCSAGANRSTVPAGDRDRFLHQVAPTLRHATSLVSVDGSVELPEPVLPRLICTVGYRPDHRLRLDWAFGYDDPLDDPQAYDLDLPVRPPTRRDVTAEQALLAGLVPAVRPDPGPPRTAGPRPRGTFSARRPRHGDLRDRGAAAAGGGRSRAGDHRRAGRLPDVSRPRRGSKSPPANGRHRSAVPRSVEHGPAVPTGSTCTSRSGWTASRSTSSSCSSRSAWAMR